MSIHKKIIAFALLLGAVGVFAFVPKGSETLLESALEVPAVAVATNATLKVGAISYPIEITAEETVLEAMRALMSATSSFAFTGQEYPALGFFVDSINGKQNADGFYWILYVNDTSANAGASSVTLQVGDTVEWRYKKGY